MAGVAKQPRGGPDVAIPEAALAWAVHHLAVAATEVDVATSRAMGLGATDYLALKYLTVLEEPPGPVELGRALGLTSGAATGLVDRLERAGHVRRSPHPRDRRRQVVTVTAAAQHQLVHRLQPLAAGLDQLAAALTEDEVHLITGILTRVAALHRSHARAVTAGPLNR
jgi:DNA-binding MarR family transcriptional regulator